MIEQLRKYFKKMRSDGCIDETHFLFLAQDDEVVSYGSSPHRWLAEKIFEQLGPTALILARPPLPVLDLLLGRIADDARVIIPNDTETRTFLHDIPVVRKDTFSGDDVRLPVTLLGQRKGILVEGVGLITTGGLTAEQAYINYSSLYHALFVKLLLLFLEDKAGASVEEQAALAPLLSALQTPIPEDCADLVRGPISVPDHAVRALDQVGKRTVALHLVDSFFGNVSCHLPGQVMISQTGASLDELPGCIDCVPDDNSSTAGITASSELIAHRAIYEKTGASVILHGHPRFSVLLSLLCEETDCPIRDCWKECDRPRFLGEVPVVAGEVGAGGLAKKVPPVIEKGIAVVYGHGVFAIGHQDFREPLRRMIALENWCRNIFFERFLQGSAK